ncbi:hypothetical protein CLU79DRAFT_162082 [Phycomyces nitens]|nr:hypothetical protein CLU79DRAFT_162082 [Phycomyces nitens]
MAPSHPSPLSNNANSNNNSNNNGSTGYFYDPSSTIQHQFPSLSGPSEETFISPSSTPPPHHALKSTACCSPSTIMTTEPPMLVASSSSTTTTSTMSSSSVDYLNETIAKASSLPESFYPEFLQYSKETYEQSTGGGQSMQRKKQRKAQSTGDSKEECMEDSDNEEDEEDGPDGGSQKGPSPIEIRRQIHIQSEQKRRAQIKDGFEDLRNELPACLNKKMSKVALLHRTVQHIQHLKDNQMSILSDLERLVHENEQLRKFQDNVFQKQAMDNMYSMGQM